ncbi:TIGR02757 family protein [Helicobacter anseris]|uniref:TIGR02757 family protein n=1 Tax=Helicobacter anseris TaxID=375926 RepID=A0A3D8JB44_9HELI|nr:TIGR02757 family protein [Helicobacter anseris]RDU74678.1 TIGR02757 family protein [Helicobacter anseris]
MKELLEEHYHHRNAYEDFSTPDPLIVLRQYTSSPYFDSIALVCALFAYGRASEIVKFLQKLDFEILKCDIQKIQKMVFPYYRFQTQEDVKNLFILLVEIQKEGGIKALMLEGYKQDGIFGAINRAIERLSKSRHNTYGMQFLFSKTINRKNLSSHSPLKRWNLFLRWLVRKDNIDFGFWSEIPTSDLILPLDTHTFKICHKLGLLQRKSYDLKSAIEVTQALKKFDCNDPIKYDFALYRIGQEKLAF